MTNKIKSKIVVILLHYPYILNWTWYETGSNFVDVIYIPYE